MTLLLLGLLSSHHVVTVQNRLLVTDRSFAVCVIRVSLMTLCNAAGRVDELIGLWRWRTTVPTEFHVDYLDPIRCRADLNSYNIKNDVDQSNTEPCPLPLD